MESNSLKKRMLNLKHEHVSNPKYETFSLKSGVASVDLRANMPPIWDQGDLGSCVAFALCASFQYCDPSFDGSQLFLYYNSRYLDYLSGDNSVSIDDGTTLSQGIRALTQYGLCGNSNWPYDVSRFAIKPPQNCYDEGLNHQIISATNVQQTLDQMQACLQAGYPFVIGILVFSSFFNDNTGVIPYPNTYRENILGGHAICVCGYDDASQRFLVRN